MKILTAFTAIMTYMFSIFVAILILLVQSIDPAELARVLAGSTIFSAFFWGVCIASHFPQKKPETKK